MSVYSTVVALLIAKYILMYLVSELSISKQILRYIDSYLSIYYIAMLTLSMPMWWAFVSCHINKHYLLTYLWSYDADK